MKHLFLKFALFGALFFLPVVFSACGDRCNQPETFYKINSLVVSLQAKDNTPTHPNLAYSFDNLMMQFECRMDYYVGLPTMYGGAGLLAWRYPVCNNEGIKGAKEKVKDIQITSNAPFQQNYPSGTSLASLMNIEAIYKSREMLNVTPLSSFLANPSEVPWNLRLYFTQAPTQDKKHIFTIRYELDNGEVYTYTTPEITFQ